MYCCMRVLFYSCLCPILLLSIHLSVLMPFRWPSRTKPCDSEYLYIQFVLGMICLRTMRLNVFPSGTFAPPRLVKSTDHPRIKAQYKFCIQDTWNIVRQREEGRKMVGKQRGSCETNTSHGVTSTQHSKNRNDIHRMRPLDRTRSNQAKSIPRAVENTD